MNARPDPVAYVDMACIAEGKILHACGQGVLAGLESQVQMIGHQAEGVQPVAKASHAFANQFIEIRAVFSVEENVLAGVTAQDDMVKTAGYVQAGFASHAVIVKERRALWN